MNKSSPSGLLFYPPKLRQDVVLYEVQTDFYIQVYWKDIKYGVGPALIVYLYGIEALKFDCLGKNMGHFHINPNNKHGNDTDMLWFSEVGILAQIERTIFELTHNLSYYLDRNDDNRIRELVIDKQQLDRVLIEAKTCLLSFVEKDPKMHGA